jgi:hypothetical protein
LIVTTALPASSSSVYLIADVDGLADIADRVRRLPGELQVDEVLEALALVDGLLDAGELDELGHELGRFERRERVLVLELGGQQHQEGVEILGEPRGGRGGGIVLARA